MKSSAVPASELMAAILELVGPFGALNDGEAASLVELNDSYLAGRDRVALDVLVPVVEQLAEFLEENGCHTEGVFRLSAPLSQLEALRLLVLFRPELVTRDVLLSASAVTVACLLKRMLASTAEPLLPLCDHPAESVTEPRARKVLHRVVLLTKALAAAPGTKMNESSFAVCLAPTLFGPDALSGHDNDPRHAAAQMQKMQQAFLDILQRSTELFPEPYERETAPHSNAVSRQSQQQSTGAAVELSFQIVGSIPVVDSARGPFNVYIIQVRSERGCFVILRRYRQIAALRERIDAVYGDGESRDFPAKSIGQLSAAKLQIRLEKLRAWFSTVAKLDNVIQMPEMIHFLTSTSSATSEMDEALPSAPFAGGLVGKDKCPVCRFAFESRGELLSHLEFSDCKTGHPVPPPPVGLTGATSSSPPLDTSPRSKGSSILQKLISPRRNSERDLSPRGSGASNSSPKSSPRTSVVSPRTSPRGGEGRRGSTALGSGLSLGSFPGIPVKLIDDYVGGGVAQSASAEHLLMFNNDGGSPGSPGNTSPGVGSPRGMSGRPGSPRRDSGVTGSGRILMRTKKSGQKDE